MKTVSLKKSMRKKLDGWKSSGQPPADELIWVKADGKHYRGRFVEVKAGRLRVQSEKFGKGSVSLDQLSPASLAFAKRLSSMGTTAKPAPEQTKPEIEAWTSTDGKVVKARFVRLEDDKLTVETAAGKSYTFPLDRLDQKSQAKAKELARDKD